MKKRCLIVLLAVVTVVTMIAAFGITAGATTPVASVTTEGGTENYTSLYDAVQAATQAGRATVTLLEDVTSDGGIVIGEGTVTIDLNGKTWNIAGWFDIRGNADVTIGDSSPSQEGKILGPESSPVVGVYDSGKLEIAGGTLEGMSGQGVISLSFAGNPTSASLVVSGGKLISKGMSVITAHGNSVTIIGGTMELSQYSHGRHIYYYKGAIDLSEYADPSGIRIYIDSDEGSPLADNIVLPDGYFLLDEDGVAQTSLVPGMIYTVDDESAPPVQNTKLQLQLKPVDSNGNVIDAALYGVLNHILLYSNYPNGFSDLSGECRISFSDGRVPMGYQIPEDVRFFVQEDGTLTSDDTTVEKVGNVWMITVVLKEDDSAVITDLCINTDSPAYDAATNTFTISQDHPLILTIRGKNLSKVEDGWVIGLISDGIYVPMTFDEIADGELDLAITFEMYQEVVSQFEAYGYSVNIDQVIVFVDYDAFRYKVFPVNITAYIPVKVKSTGEGTVTFSPIGARDGDTVTLNVVPAEGYLLDTLTVTDKDGNPVSVDENYSFTVPEGGVAVYATFIYDVHYHDKDGYEIVWSETFNGDTLPDGFTSVDVDGDGYGWMDGTEAKSHGMTIGSHSCQSGFSLLSLPGDINTQNLLVLPTFELEAGESYLFSFLAVVPGATSPECCNVHVSLDGGKTYVRSRGIREVSEYWTEITTDLSEYAGQSVTVVIEHKDDQIILIDCCQLYKKLHVCSDGVKQNGQTPTCEEDGFSDYYQCKCGKVYRDEACTDEIEDLDAWKAGEGKLNGSHSIGELIPAVEETHTVDDLKASVAAHYFCTACNTYFTEEMEKTTLEALTGELPAHSYGAEWLFDGENHWHVCSCGKTSEAATHSGGTATCEAKAKCSTCQAEYGELAEHTFINDKCECGKVDPSASKPVEDDSDQDVSAKDNGGVSTGVIIGIILGSVAIVGVGALLIFRFVIKKKR